MHSELNCQVRLPLLYVQFYVGKLAESKCTCPNVLAGVLSSTVIIFLVISIVTFITGFLLGNHFKISFQFFNAKPHTTTDHPHQAPEYEDIDAQPFASAVKHQEQALELKKNMAYGPSNSMFIEKQ